MPKQYYVNMQLAEVARVSVDNYKKVDNWIESQKLNINLHVSAVADGVQVSLLSNSTTKESEMGRNIKAKIGQDCYIVRFIESGEVHLLKESEWSKIDAQKAHYLMQYFNYRHLSGPAKVMSKRFADLATQIDLILPESPEKTMALRKLLESKDCSVRATFYQE